MEEMDALTYEGLKKKASAFFEDDSDPVQQFIVDFNQLDFNKIIQKYSTSPLKLPFLHICRLVNYQYLKLINKENMSIIQDQSIRIVERDQLLKMHTESDWGKIGSGANFRKTFQVKYLEEFENDKILEIRRDEKNSWTDLKLTRLGWVLGICLEEGVSDLCRINAELEEYDLREHLFRHLERDKEKLYGSRPGILLNQDPQLLQLRRHIQHQLSSRGNNRILQITGESGLGKTNLIYLIEEKFEFLNWGNITKLVRINLTEILAFENQEEELIYQIWQKLGYDDKIPNNLTSLLTQITVKQNKDNIVLVLDQFDHFVAHASMQQDQFSQNLMIGLIQRLIDEPAIPIILVLVYPEVNNFQRLLQKYYPNVDLRPGPTYTLQSLDTTELHKFLFDALLRILAAKYSNNKSLGKMLVLLDNLSKRVVHVLKKDNSILTFEFIVAGRKFIDLLQKQDNIEEIHSYSDNQLFEILQEFLTFEDEFRYVKEMYSELFTIATKLSTSKITNFYKLTSNEKEVVDQIMLRDPEVNSLFVYTRDLIGFRHEIIGKKFESLNLNLSSNQKLVLRNLDFVNEYVLLTAGREIYDLPPKQAIQKLFADQSIILELYEYKEHHEKLVLAMSILIESRYPVKKKIFELMLAKIAELLVTRLKLIELHAKNDNAIVLQREITTNIYLQIYNMNDQARKEIGQYTDLVLMLLKLSPKTVTNQIIKWIFENELDISLWDEKQLNQIPNYVEDNFSLQNYKLWEWDYVEPNIAHLYLTLRAQKIKNSFHIHSFLSTLLLLKQERSETYLNLTKIQLPSEVNKLLEWSQNLKLLKNLPYDSKSHHEVEGLFQIVLSILEMIELHYIELEDCENIVDCFQKLAIGKFSVKNFTRNFQNISSDYLGRTPIDQDENLSLDEVSKIVQMIGLELYGRLHLENLEDDYLDILESQLHYLIPNIEDDRYLRHPLLDLYCNLIGTQINKIEFEELMGQHEKIGEKYSLLNLPNIECNIHPGNRFYNLTLNLSIIELQKLFETQKTWTLTKLEVLLNWFNKFTSDLDKGDKLFDVRYLANKEYPSELKEFLNKLDFLHEELIDLVANYQSLLQDFIEASDVYLKSQIYSVIWLIFGYYGIPHLDKIIQDEHISTLTILLYLLGELQNSIPDGALIGKYLPYMLLIHYDVMIFRSLIQWSAAKGILPELLSSTNEAGLSYIIRFSERFGREDEYWAQIMPHLILVAKNILALAINSHLEQLTSQSVENSYLKWFNNLIEKLQNQFSRQNLQVLNSSYLGMIALTETLQDVESEVIDPKLTLQLAECDPDFTKKVVDILLQPTIFLFFSKIIPHDYQFAEPNTILETVKTTIPHFPSKNDITFRIERHESNILASLSDELIQSIYQLLENKQLDKNHEVKLIFEILKENNLSQFQNKLNILLGDVDLNPLLDLLDYEINGISNPSGKIDNCKNSEDDHKRMLEWLALEGRNISIIPWISKILDRIDPSNLPIKTHIDSDETADNIVVSQFDRISLDSPKLILMLMISSISSILKAGKLDTENQQLLNSIGLKAEKWIYKLFDQLELSEISKTKQIRFETCSDLSDLSIVNPPYFVRKNSEIFNTNYYSDTYSLPIMAYLPSIISCLNLIPEDNKTRIEKLLEKNMITFQKISTEQNSVSSKYWELVNQEPGLKDQNVNLQEKFRVQLDELQIKSSILQDMYMSFIIFLQANLLPDQVIRDVIDPGNDFIIKNKYRFNYRLDFHWKIISELLRRNYDSHVLPYWRSIRTNENSAKNFLKQFPRMIKSLWPDDLDENIVFSIIDKEYNSTKIQNELPWPLLRRYHIYRHTNPQNK